MLREVAINVTEIEIQEEIESKDFRIVKIKKFIKNIRKNEGQTMKQKMSIFIIDFKHYSNIHIKHTYIH